jgi:sterol desaturase/sphingolipid hydroxylase (fatty acid hydroxylase superfamily)
MDTRLIALAVPFFFLLIGIESVVSRVQRVRRYRLHDTITSLGCGIGEQMIVVFTVGLSVAAYAYAEKHIAIMHVPASSVLGWVLVFILVDHSFYWFHRAAHRVNFMWAGHAVHHQSEEYNLSTALRQNWIENLLAWPFYLPLAMLGFPLAMFATASTVNTLYQFWVHTRIIKRMGPVEGLLNTPSSHRVHHGIDPEYVDKNYGGMFMIWDRLYRTYQREEAEPHYGTVKPLESWSPLWANVHGWVRMWTMARSTSRFSDKVRVWFAPPDWQPADLGGTVTVPAVDVATYRKFDRETPRLIDRYVLGQFAVVALVTSAIMWFAATLPTVLLVASVAWVIAALVGWGGLFEGKAWAVPLEGARHVAGVVLGVLLMQRGYGPAVLWAAVGAGVVSTFVLVRTPTR